MTLSTPGPQSLTVTDGNGKTGTESNILVVSPATHLGITTSATKLTAGGQLTVTVRGLTESNTTDTLFADTLQLTTSDPNAQVVAGSMSSGVQTFTITYPSAGSWSIAVTDLSRPTIKGLAPSISVVAGAAAQLSVTGMPLFALANASEQITVTAEDAYGNRVLSGFTDTVGIAGQSWTFKAAEHGTHVFTTKLSTPGTQSLTATDTSHSNVQKGSSGNITIVSGSPALVTDPANSAESALVVIAPRRAAPSSSRRPTRRERRSRWR